MTKNDLTYLIETDLSDPNLNQLYTERNQIIEHFIRIMHTFLIKVSIPFGAIPIATLSYYLYFTTDLGNDAFLLPFHIK